MILDLCLTQLLLLELKVLTPIIRRKHENHSNNMLEFAIASHNRMT